MADTAYIILDGETPQDEKPLTMLERWSKENRNVRLILAIVAFAGLSESMGFGAALSAYLYISTGRSNLRVGFLESAMGLTKLVTALPMGDFADNYGRAPVGKMGAFAYTIATVMTVYAIIARTLAQKGSGGGGGGYDTDDDDDSDDADALYIFWLWIVALCLWGFGKGVVDGPVLALFADSVATGDRTKYYFYLYVVWWFGALAGPVVAVMIFLCLSNDWTFKELSVVLYVALAFKLANAAQLCFLKDSDALGDEATHVSCAAPAIKVADGSVDGDDKSNDNEAVGGRGGGGGGGGGGDGGAGGGLGGDYGEDELAKISEFGGSGGGDQCDDDGVGLLQQKKKEQEERQGRIPLLVFVASLVSKLGSGMTVKFFPLFFMIDCRMSPAAVQGIYVGVPLSMLVAGKVGERLAFLNFGRVQAIVLFKGLGALSLLVFVWLQRFRTTTSGGGGGGDDDKDEGVASANLLALLFVPPFLLSTALTDATFPLEESILMDFVPANRRARWKSLESVAQAGWCGSAVLGGYLVDKYDYSATFLITALVQGAAVLIWVALLPLVPKVEKRAELADPDSAATTAADSADSATDPAAGTGLGASVGSNEEVNLSFQGEKNSAATRASRFEPGPGQDQSHSRTGGGDGHENGVTGSSILSPLIATENP